MMSTSFGSFWAKTYTVSTPVFEGPLDLLLQLIERAEFDITKLALAQVTDQYLEYLKNLQQRTAEEVSAFIVIAARLLQIKSEALLPRFPSREEHFEDPAETLIRQLVIYKKFKEIAESFAEREEAGLRTYLRMAQPIKVNAQVDLSGLTVQDLAEAARILFLNRSLPDVRESLNTIVAAPKITIREKIKMIAKRLRERGKTSFLSMFGENRSRLEVVVTFLAVLELVKRHYVNVYQTRLFGEIELEPTEIWDESDEFELEFGE